MIKFNKESTIQKEIRVDISETEGVFYLVKYISINIPKLLDVTARGGVYTNEKISKKYTMIFLFIFCGTKLLVIYCARI